MSGHRLARKFGGFADRHPFVTVVAGSVVYALTRTIWEYVLAWPMLRRCRCAERLVRELTNADVEAPHASRR